MMTQGLPLQKSMAFADLARKIARRADTLHILVFVLRQQAEQSGDEGTVALINKTLKHINDGDSIKLALAALLQADTSDKEPGWSAKSEGRYERPLRERYETCLIAILNQALRMEALEGALEQIASLCASADPHTAFDEIREIAKRSLK